MLDVVQASCAKSSCTAGQSECTKVLAWGSVCASSLGQRDQQDNIDDPEGAFQVTATTFKQRNTNAGATCPQKDRLASCKADARWCASAQRPPYKKTTSNGTFNDVQYRHLPVQSSVLLGNSKCVNPNCRDVTSSRAQQLL